MLYVNENMQLGMVKTHWTCKSYTLARNLSVSTTDAGSH